MISYQILKSFESKNVWTLIKLFKTYIRPKLEYNTPVWSPYLLKDIKAIEKIQKRFTKSIFRRCNIPFSSYLDRLYKLNLLSLENRRIRNDLILFFKIINNLSDLNFDDYFKFQFCDYSLRGGSSKVVSTKELKDRAWLKSFFERAPYYWNKLEPSLRSVKSLDIFKIKLQTVNYDYLKKSLKS